MTDIGDNSAPGLRDKLRSFVGQIVHTEREINGLKTDIQAYYTAAKDAGISVPALRVAVKRSMESPTKRAAREELENLVDQYLSATGMLD